MDDTLITREKTLNQVNVDSIVTELDTRRKDIVEVRSAAAKTLQLCREGNALTGPEHRVSEKTTNVWKACCTVELEPCREEWKFVKAEMSAPRRR